MLCRKWCFGQGWGRGRRLDEIVRHTLSVCLAFPFSWGSILWFDPRREHSSVPTAVLTAAARRACQGWPRLRGHPLGLGLDWPEHGGMLIGSGLQALTTLGKFKPMVLGEIQAAGDSPLLCRSKNIAKSSSHLSRRLTAARICRANSTSHCFRVIIRVSWLHYVVCYVAPGTVALHSCGVESQDRHSQFAEARA